MRAGLAAIVLAVSAAPAVAASGDAAAGAKAWVGLIDQGRYAQSWTAAGALFRAQVTSPGWVRMVAGVRGPFGTMVSRTLISDQRSTSLPGAPDGHYAMLKFNTAFAHKREAVETVVMADEPSGWRVDGYYIR